MGCQPAPRRWRAKLSVRWIPLEIERGGKWNAIINRRFTLLSGGRMSWSAPFRERLT